MPKWQARSKPPQPCPWCTGILQEFSGNVPSVIVYTLQNTARRGIGSVISPKCEYLCSDVFVSEYTSFLGVGLHFNLQLRKCRNAALLDALVTVRRHFCQCHCQGRLQRECFVPFNIQSTYLRTLQSCYHRVLSLCQFSSESILMIEIIIATQSQTMKSQNDPRRMAEY